MKNTNHGISESDLQSESDAFRVMFVRPWSMIVALNEKEYFLQSDMSFLFS